MPPKKHPLAHHYMSAKALVPQAAVRQAIAKHFKGGIGGFGMHHPTMHHRTHHASHHSMGGLLLGGARKKHTVGHAKNQARGAIVRQVMAQHGMTLPQASHYVKAHNIPY